MLEGTNTNNWFQTKTTLGQQVTKKRRGAKVEVEVEVEVEVLVQVGCGGDEDQRWT